MVPVRGLPDGQPNWPEIPNVNPVWALRTSDFVRENCHGCNASSAWSEDKLVLDFRSLLAKCL